MFLKETGLSPTEYMNNLRIEKAKKLLTDNSQESSISDIAEQCGIKDPFYFSRIFKKFTGDTPSEYRRKVAPKVRP
jgi:YesN/AraC family two-component response regulator